MQVIVSHRRDWRARCARLAVVGALCTGLAGAVHAAEFNEKLRAPAMQDAAGVQTRVQSMTARFEQLKQQAPERLVTDRALFRERTDLYWQMQQAINAGKLTEDLPAVGVERRDDGSYAVDLVRFPQWADSARTIPDRLANEDWPRFAGALAQLGMRPDELATLRQYLDDRNPLHAARQATLPLALSFARVVKKFDRLKRPVPDAMVSSYLYQRNLAAGEAQRAWLEDLLKTLGAHGARILQAHYEETAVRLIWLPDDAAGIAGVLADVRRPDFEELAIREAQGGAP